MTSSLNKKEALQRLLIQVSSHSTSGSDSLLIPHLFLKQAHLISSDDPTILQRLCINVFNFKDYAKALNYAEQWFLVGQKETDPNIRATMFFVRGACLFYLKQYSRVAENLKKAITGFVQSKDNDKAKEARRILEEELPLRTQEEPNVEKNILI